MVKNHAKGDQHTKNNSDPTKSNMKMYFKPKTIEKSMEN